MTLAETETATAPPLEIQRILVQQEMDLWIRTRYQARVRLRVQQAIGADKDQQAALIADLERCELAIDALQAELDALPVEARPA